MRLTHGIEDSQGAAEERVRGGKTLRKGGESGGQKKGGSKQEKGTKNRENETDKI